MHTTTTTSTEEGIMTMTEIHPLNAAIERLSDMYHPSCIMSMENGLIEVDGGNDDETRGFEAYAYRTLKVFGNVASTMEDGITRQYATVGDGEWIIVIETRLN